MAIGNNDVSYIVLECVQCKQNFEHFKDSDLHVKETHHKVNAKYQCSKCEKYFGNNQILQLHLRVHDSEDSKSEPSLTSEINHPSSQNEVMTKGLQAPTFPEQIFTTSLTDSSKHQVKKTVGLTKIKLEDCLRCDACSCIYMDESDYNKHMKNFHRTNSARKPKQRKGCRSCCKHCNCQGNHPSQTIQNDWNNKNLFHVNIKDRWTKMVSYRLKKHNTKSNNPVVKHEIKTDPDGPSSGLPILDYADLLSKVEVKIKTEPPDEPESLVYQDE